ncbi:MAG: CBS domain-containing protein [Oligoflexia bacterium]|nr:CBS domain-containing protein [Oligoflexia bacterium]
MKSVPAIQKYMTVLPHSIGDEQTLEKAREMMNEYRIRHLPVLHGGKIMGVITDRDIKLVSGFQGADLKTLKVSDAYTPEPYITSPNAALDEVVAFMAEKKYGCAIIADNNKLVGIFTEVDALRALSELLQTRLRH